MGGAGPSPNISGPPPPFSYNIPPMEPLQPSPDDNSSAPPPYFPPEVQKQDLSQETPAVTPGPSGGGGSAHLDLPDLPPVPSDTPLGGNTPQVQHSASLYCAVN